VSMDDIARAAVTEPPEERAFANPRGARDVVHRHSARVAGIVEQPARGSEHRLPVARRISTFGHHNPLA